MSRRQPENKTIVAGRDFNCLGWRNGLTLELHESSSGHRPEFSSSSHLSRRPVSELSRRVLLRSYKRQKYPSAVVTKLVYAMHCGSHCLAIFAASVVMKLIVSCRSVISLCPLLKRTYIRSLLVPPGSMCLEKWMLFE